MVKQRLIRLGLWLLCVLLMGWAYLAIDPGEIFAGAIAMAVFTGLAFGTALFFLIKIVISYVLSGKPF